MAEMNKEIMKLYLKSLASKEARRQLRQHYKQEKLNKLKLIMTLVVKDEENIIEQNIRFHKAMGVDGFIVTSHNSTDKTNEILEKLKKEGIVLEIIYETCPDHKHHVWVNKMVKTAQKKYGAVWVINADADEFYYSKDLNLKKSIMKYENIGVNVLRLDSTFLFPDDSADFLHCPYFVRRTLLEYEAKMLGTYGNDDFFEYTAPSVCRKVIHKTKGFKSIVDGNHDVIIKGRKEAHPFEITLYHFRVKNYAEYENRAKKWLEAASYMPEGMGWHMKAIITEYKNGSLRQNYEAKYGKQMRNFLSKQGIVVIDKSVSNFLKFANIKSDGE